MTFFITSYLYVISLDQHANVEFIFVFTIRKKKVFRRTYLENKGLIEYGIQCLFVHLGVKLFLFVREEKDFNVRV